MQDSFGRKIDYLRVSVTDRCDLRCAYCMNDEMVFLPRDDILSLEEIERLCAVFVKLGVRKLRITGGEPLVRRNVIRLFERLGTRLGQGLDELSLTTNGTRLAEYAQALAGAGVRRVNISLDTLNEDRFKKLTRHGDLSTVLNGIAAAKRAGLRVKLNCVLMKGVNDQEIPKLMEWSHGQGFDLVLIETMPMGPARADIFVPLEAVLDRLALRYSLQETQDRTNGPASYMKVLETGGRLGLIAPLSRHFCDSCNRVRLTASGKLHLCLGKEDGVDLKRMLREGGSDHDLEAGVLHALAVKPRGHDFVPGGTLSQGAGGVRPMSATGG